MDSYGDEDELAREFNDRGEFDDEGYVSDPELMTAQRDYQF